MHKANHCRTHRHQILLICTALSLLLCYSRCGSLNHSMVSGDRVQTTKIDLPLSISASPPGHCHPHPSVMIPRGASGTKLFLNYPLRDSIIPRAFQYSVFLSGCTSLRTTAGLGPGAREMLVGSRVQFGDLFPVSTVSEARSHEGHCSCDAHCSCLCGASSAVRHFKGIIWPDFVNIRDWWRIDSMITGVIGLSQR